MKRNHFYFFIRNFFKPFFFLKFRMKYIGAENVPPDGAYILASNHRRAVDPILMGMGLKRQVLFMAKEELFQNWFTKWFLSKLGAFPISRGKADTGSIRHFEQALEEGNLMGIFIEGTRAKDDNFLPPKNGVSLIAWDTKTPVIPVCHTKIGGRIVMHFGKPLSLEEMGFVKGGAREFRTASRIIMDHIKAIREEDLLAAEEKQNA